MAIHCADNHTRTKCSVSRGLQCKLIICFLICLNLIKICVADDVSVFMYPRGDLYVRHGDDLEMLCIAGQNYTAQDLSFSLSGYTLPAEVINDTTIRLFLQRPKEHPRETYYCTNSKSKAIAIKTVYVASPPAEVTDFKCISRNIDVLNCTWTTPDKIIFTNYSLSFLVNTVPVKPCIANTVENSLLRYCYWNISSAPRYRQQEDKYNFVLESDNVFGNRTQDFIIDHFSVVKPDPPDLKNISVTAHSVLLSWTIPYNIHHFLPGGIDHKIEYQIAKIDNTSYFRQVNTADLPPNNRTYKFNLTALPYAHRQYGVRVYIKPKRAKSAEFWSDFSNLVFYTASERPSRPPEMIAGAFDQSKFTGGRYINIYWKQLEEFEEAGANFTYKILVSQGGKTRTYRPSENKSLGYLSLTDYGKESLDSMEVHVYSENEMGSSDNCSSLYIPAEEDTKYLRLASFTKLAYENGTYELSWAGSGYDIDNYTLFWCQHNTTNICTGRINFTVLKSTKNKHIIDLPRDYRYQFAISANKGLKTSGMIWAKCDISKDGIAMYDFPIRFVDHDAPGKTYVKLKWSMDCTLKEGIINAYNITYCPVIKTSTQCDNTLGQADPFIITDPKQMEATITGLRPYTTYQFTMALNTTYGLKTIENATIRITTPEDTPTQPRNVKIFEVENDSFFISWELPRHLNGHISQIKYVINYNAKSRTVKYEGQEQFKVKIDGLTGFTNYTVTLQACNEGIVSCSNKTNPVKVRTRIGPPSQMTSPSFNNNILSWTPPESAGGTLDRYQIRIVRDAVEEILINTSSTSERVQSCEGAVQNVTYQVRAINCDEDVNHGAWTDSEKVTLPIREKGNTTMLTFYGEWSKESTVLCTSKDNLILLFIIMGVLAIIGIGCGVLKTYKKIRKMGDITPEFPKGLFIPEKEISKYPFTGIYPSDKDEKPMSDEMLLLPDNKNTVTSPEIKNADSENCGSSDHTDSTALSDASQGPVGRQNSTSDESSHSSLHLEVESPKPESNNLDSQEGDSSSTGTDSSSESSPYLSENAFKKNKTTGYVQPVVSPATGYVQAVPQPPKTSPAKSVPMPTTSSYVMAGLSPSIFTAGPLSAGGTSQPPPPTGYVRAEDIEARNAMNFPRLGPSPTKIFGTESLPVMPNLPAPAKHGADSSYIQLQSLDSLPSHKPNVRNTVPFKPVASSGYVRPEDAVINKHLNNFMSGPPSSEESAILDPAMSPDAYCRFSWSTDPTNDNLHSLLANSNAINPSKN